MTPSATPKTALLAQTISLIEALPTAALLIDHHGRLLHCSSSCHNLLGTNDLDWLNDSLAAITLPDAGLLTTYLTTPNEQALTLQWGAAQATGYIVLVADSTVPVSDISERLSMATLPDLADQSQFLASISSTLTALTNQEDNQSIMCIGLTGLRAINDSLGYRCVDRLLKLFVERMLDAGFTLESMGRLSSGEFLLYSGGTMVVQQSDSEVDAPAGQVSEYILDLATRPYIIEETLVSVGCTIGTSSYDANNREKLNKEFKNPLAIAEELLRRSVVARLGALQQNQTGYLYFTQAMDDEIKRRRELENDLRRAIALQEFELYFQPKIDLSSSNIIGFEALIRWNHPTRGLVSPFEFIPAAESLGLIIPIGEWVITEACRCAAAWPAGISVAINLSPIQFAQDNLCEVIHKAISASGIDPNQIELEITESVLLGDGAGPSELDVVDVLRELKETGIQISIDDFGTGYSSLSYLAKFPFDTLKIDQSFVRDEKNEQNNALIRGAIVALGKKFNMSIVAEGIETEEQLNTLSEEHCDIGQGYLFGKPLPYSHSFTLLNQYNQLNLTAQMVTDDAESKLDALTSGDRTSARAESDEKLLRLVYLSSNLIEYDSDVLEREISQIMTSCLNNNAEADVSGALMFNHSVFAQVLEGPPRNVEQTFERIQRDNRHANVVVLDCRRVSSRAFPNWAMAFIGESGDNETAFREIATLTDFSDKPVQGDKILQTLLDLVYQKSGENQQAA